MAKEPKYEEIEHQQADLLQKYNIDLESFWSDWSAVYEDNIGQPLSEVILKRGEDFDIIVYGIPVGTLSFLCEELLEKSPSLRATNENIVRVPSLQIQLWGNFDLHEYESSELKHILVDIVKEKAVHLIYNNDAFVKLEDWGNLKPKHILYTPSNSTVNEIPDRNYSSFPKEQLEKDKKFAIHIVQSVLKNISPSSFQNGVFDWTLLTDPYNRSGEEHFDSQYIRLNVNPSDLYTQIKTNISQYRIKTDGSGFDNIYFTGDWIQNGFNYGATESAITAGLLTS